MIQIVTKTYTRYDGSRYHLMRAYVNGDLLDFLQIDEGHNGQFSIQSIKNEFN